jgi:hypothetical protein
MVTELTGVLKQARAQNEMNGVEQYRTYCGDIER